MKFRSAAAVALLAATLTGTAVQPAEAAPKSSVQSQIDSQLRNYPGGTQISATELAYDAGNTVVTFASTNKPSSTASASLVASCPAGWACFYDGINMAGRMLKFQSCNIEQYFSTYGFQNMTSSYANGTYHAVYTYDNEALLWREDPNSQQYWVGGAADNRADSLFILC